MASVVQECPICLDRFRDPVVTPCGHLSCGACMGTHVRASRDSYEATCPTCRAPFPIVTPDMSMIPKKYHVFISPSLRRVYMGEDTLIDSLNTEITILQARVGTLKRDKDLLMDRCESAQSAVHRLSTSERTARHELRDAKKEALQANENFETLKAAYLSLESTHLSCSADTKRKSGQAAIDSPGSSPRKPKGFSNGRPVKPMPKRARLQPTMTAGSSAQIPPGPTTLRFVDTDVDRSSLSFSSRSSSSPSPSASTSIRPSAPTHSGSGSTTASRTRATRHATSSSSDSDRSESDGDGGVDVNVFAPRYHYHTRSRTTYTGMIEFPRLRLERSTTS